MTDSQNEQPPVLQEKAPTFFTNMAQTKRYLKAALQGFAGSGKTFTSAQIAVGLHKKIKSTKPIAIIDTEQASKFLTPFFKANGIEAIVRETRSLADVNAAVRLCEEGASDILIIDSLSHVWEDLLKSFQKRVGRVRLQIQDWGIIKPMWKEQFSDRIVSAKTNIIFTGRAGYEYENEINAETGKREMYKSGVKMKVEGETAYEPDLLIMMERFEKILGDDKEVSREATVLKDRSNIIDGKTFKNPTFKDFEPVVDFLLTSVVDDEQQTESVDTGSLFDLTDEGYRRREQREIKLEEIEAMMVKAAPGQTAAEKKIKIEMLEECFGTTSWTKVTTLPFISLDAGIIKLKEIVAALNDGKKKTDAEGLKPEPKMPIEGKESETATNITNISVEKPAAKK